MLKNLDVILLSAPVLIPILTGIGFGHLQSYKNPVFKAVGYLGNRACVMLTVLFGMPVLLYSVAKFVLSKTLATLTFGKIRLIKRFAGFCENQFKTVQCVNLAATLLLPKTKSVVEKTHKLTHRF